MAKGDITVQISGAGAKARAGRVEVGGWNAWGRGGGPETSPEIVARVRRTLDGERTATARAENTAKVPKRSDAIVKAVEQVPRRPPNVSVSEYARRIRVQVEAALRANKTLKGKRGLGERKVRDALVAAEKILGAF